jgi:predicted dehydrogenase
MNAKLHCTTTTEGKESRRTFLRRAAALAAAGSSSLMREPVYGQNQAPSANVQGANNRVVLGIVGAGKQGKNHIKRLTREASTLNLRIGAVCDVYQKHLDGALQAAELTADCGYREHERLLERTDLDAILIATVDNWHGQVTLDGLEAGKHVYCEKPMSRYLQEGWDVYDKVRASGLVYQYGSQYTADAVYHQAARWIQEDLLGPLVWAQSSYCRNNPKNSEWTFPVDADANPQNLDWERWLGRAPKIPWTPEHYFSWHKYYAYNSGILGNLLSHRFPPLMLAAGEPEWPRRVVCTGTRKVSTDREITDTTHILAEFPSGLSCVIAGSTVNEIGLQDMIRGRQGTLYFSGNRLEFRPERVFADELDQATFTDENPVGKIEHLHANFVDCIRNGASPYGAVDLAVKANTVLGLAEMSERMNLALMFDAHTRVITTGTGEEIPPLTYDTELPFRTS